MTNNYYKFNFQCSVKNISHVKYIFINSSNLLICEYFLNCKRTLHVTIKKKYIIE